MRESKVSVTLPEITGLIRFITKNEEKYDEEADLYIGIDAEIFHDGEHFEVNVFLGSTELTVDIPLEDIKQVLERGEDE